MKAEDNFLHFHIDLYLSPITDEENIKDPTRTNQGCDSLHLVLHSARRSFLPLAALHLFCQVAAIPQEP